jgi:hypothetical protein
MDKATHQGTASDLDLCTLLTVIERSPIRVPSAVSRLPAGFDAVDIAILDWIAAHARAHRHAFARM